jgi:hypothetical protein
VLVTMASSSKLVVTTATATTTTTPLRIPPRRLQQQQQQHHHGIRAASSHLLPTIQSYFSPEKFSGLRSSVPLSMSSSSTLSWYPSIASIVSASATSYFEKRSLSTSNNPKAVRSSSSSSKGDEDEEDASLTTTTRTYFDRKTEGKEGRIKAYQHKLQRRDQLKHRRKRSSSHNNNNSNHQHELLLKPTFRSWWDSRQAREEQWDRRARQAGLEWQIQVAVIVERLPVVLPDKHEYETDYEALRAYIQSHSGKVYPKEFVGETVSGNSDSRPVALTDEELIGTSSNIYIYTLVVCHCWDVVIVYCHAPVVWSFLSLFREEEEV